MNHKHIILSSSGARRLHEILVEFLHQSKFSDAEAFNDENFLLATDLSNQIAPKFFPVHRDVLETNRYSYCVSAYSQEEAEAIVDAKEHYSEGYSDCEFGVTSGEVVR